MGKIKDPARYPHLGTVEIQSSIPSGSRPSSQSHNLRIHEEGVGALKGCSVESRGNNYWIELPDRFGWKLLIEVKFRKEV